MKKPLTGLVCALMVFSGTFISWKPIGAKKAAVNAIKPITASELFGKYISNIYESAHLGQSGLGFDVFKKAITGFINLKLSNQLPQSSSILTVIDFSKSSREKRMWIIDVAAKDLLLNTWVAHGEGSGGDFATRFSDRIDSHESSLGFYITDDVYYGKHGRSLRLDGLDAGFNSNARVRDIVVHAAGYVSERTIEKEGRLGRSFGCPAVSPKVADAVIDAIKDKTLMFINAEDAAYTSKYLDEQPAAGYIASGSGSAYLANI